MTLTVDHDRVTFQAAGAFSTVIKRPQNVGLDEWERFWGGDNPVVNGFPDRSLTHDSALAAHKKQFGE